MMNRTLFVSALIVVMIACADLRADRAVDDKPTIPPEYQAEVQELEEKVRSFHQPIMPEISSRHAKVHRRLGIIYYEIGADKEAKYNLTRSIQMVSGVAESHLYLGRVYRRLQRHGKAVDEFKMTLEIDPSMVEAHKELSELYQQMGMLSEADAELRRYFNARPVENP